MKIQKMLHTASGRIGKVMNILAIPGIDDDNNTFFTDMYELAFDGQLWTECFSVGEIESVQND